MAFPEISEFGSNPVFQTLIAQGKTSSPEFTFKLNTSGSSLFLGGVDSDLFTGTFTKVPVTQVVGSFCTYHFQQTMAGLLASRP